MAGGAPAGRDPPFGAERLSESECTRVTRLFLTGRTVIRKEPLGPDSERRLRYERAALQRLRGVDGVAQLVDAPQYPGSLVMVDAGSTSLAVMAKPLAVGELIGTAVRLAGAVARMHRRGVMHCDIAPANIVMSEGGGPCLVDFALATSLAEIRPEFVPRSEIVGTLAYLAPEQTGRTGRSVDQRADLYALGATLYELATGTPPLGSGDPLRLIHDHLARVPVPPAQLNPVVPGPLSAIIMRLLEKEPDHRYQTAEGLLYDLERVRDAQADPGAAAIRIGERDVSLRLRSPSRLVDRIDEVTALRTAFEETLAGRCHGVVVSGAPGVGKTVLVDQLRSVVTGRDGWFLAGKFDQYRRDLEFNAVYQAFRALGRLLLAEPEEKLTAIRERILAAIGANAGLLTAVIPEFATLLAAPPDAGDPLTAQVRAQQVGAQALRAIASRERPVAVFIDDLQWTGRTPLGFVDLLLSEEPVEGLLLVAAYRDAEVDSAHPLAAPLSRWREQAGVRHLRLHNLSVPGSVTMAAEMLHVAPAAAADLVEVIEPHTSGNPYETVELLNALRRDGVLTATATGWSWDTATVRAHLGRPGAGGLAVTPGEAMPPPTRQLVEAMACLGGRAELTVLQTATGEQEAAVNQVLAPALEEGVLVMEPGAHPAVRFRHDRIRETILRRLGPRRRRALQLAMARRLARAPELFAVAAEQYLPVVDAVHDAAERRQVVELLRNAADQAALIGDHAPVHVLLAAALRLVEPNEIDTRVELHAENHAALFSLGRLEEADEQYRAIERLSTSAVQRVDATCVQVRSLTHRKRSAEAIDLGIVSLRECGITVPAADTMPAELDHQFGYLYRWLDHTDTADDLARPEITDPPLIAATQLIDAMLSSAYFAADAAMHAWLAMEAVRIWLEHGPGRTVLGPSNHAAFATISMRGDCAAGYRAGRRVLVLSEAHGYEPDTSLTRFLVAVHSWYFEPIENGVAAMQRAREGLIAGGNLTDAGYTYQSTVDHLLDCAPSLDAHVAEVEAGLSFVRRTGSEQTGQLIEGYRWLVHVLRGERSADEAVPAGRYVDNQMALFYAHVTHAVAAAIFGDPVNLTRHVAALTPLPPGVPSNYPSAVVYVLRGLSLAGRARATDVADRSRLLSELDDVIRWLASRAADAPDNFLHLLRLLDAERAWAAGDFHAAALAFDTALRAAAARQRPWHRALITEHAGQFHLAHGLEHTGNDLLAQARQEYLAWGATAKATQLDWARPTLQPYADTSAEHRADQPADAAHRRSAVTTGTLDLLGILSASQALSSETSIERLHARVVEVLGALTGATGVHLLLWSDDRHDWLLPAAGGNGSTLPIAGTGHEQALPMSVLRYVQRTGEVLIVGDAADDERFARDPYLASLDCCALLAVPILSRGMLRAVLLLENRLIRAAFTTERLDAVKLIAGQLAVSLDNAQLYTELTTSRARIVTTADQTRRRIERNLHDGAQQRLVSLALRARAAQAMAPPETSELAEQFGDLAAEATSALEELLELARGIHPAILSKGGLRPALRTLAQHCAVPVELDVEVDRRLPEQIEIAAYYLVAEALTNAAKHAHATVVDVRVDTVSGDHGGGALRVRVRDDGRGGADIDTGSGLVGLKDRVEALGGVIMIESPPGRGTALHATLPIRHNRAD